MDIMDITRNVLDMVHDDANDGEYKNFEFNLVLNILIVFSELILSYTLGSPQTQHIALNSNVNLRYFFIFSQSTW